MSKYWIKLWTEILTDVKMVLLPDNLWRRAIECFLMADADGHLPPLNEIAYYTQTNPSELLKNLKYLEEKGIVYQDNAQNWVVTNYVKRQAPVSPARRKREQRKREQSNSHELVTKRDETRHEPVTKNRPEDRRQNTTTTTTTTAQHLTDFVLTYLSRRGRVSQSITDDVQRILQTYDHADIDYAINEAERKSTSENDKCNLAYIEAICKRRQSGEPDLKKESNGQKRSTQRKRKITSPTSGAEGGGRIEADQPTGISLD